MDLNEKKQIFYTVRYWIVNDTRYLRIAHDFVGQIMKDYVINHYKMNEDYIQKFWFCSSTGHYTIFSYFD